MQTKEEKEKILDFLNKISEEEILVVVEGPNDKIALAHFAVNNVITLSRKPLFAVVEEIIKKRVKKCILLTDLDTTGKEIYGKLKKDLSRFGVIIDDSFRKFLFKETKLRQIEGLVNYLRKK